MTCESGNHNGINRTTLICVILLSVANACGGLLGLDSSGGAPATSGAGGYASTGVGGTGSGATGTSSGGTVPDATGTDVGDCSGVPSDLLLDAGLNQSCKWVAWNTVGTTNSSSCDYTLPPSANGTSYDSTYIALYLFPTIGIAEQIPLVSSQDTCAKSVGGFSFDNPSNPIRVFLCPCTCAHAQTVGGQMEIMLTCGLSGP
jgi:hypothetical protein